MTPIKYNDHGWWDPHGHLYLMADTDHGVKPFSDVVHDSFHHAVHAAKQAAPALTDDAAKEIVRAKGIKLKPTEQQPLYLRCNKTNVIQLTLKNRLEHTIAATPFDKVWPKGSDIEQTDGTFCTAFVNKEGEYAGKYKGECGLHVHIVKFDPIACDGASTGWNYISAPSISKKLVYRWWADEEFGTIFTHDHLFANFRQKHGLFAALIVEPETATFHDPTDLHKTVLVGQNAVIKYQENGVEKAYREFCLGMPIGCRCLSSRRHGSRSTSTCVIGTRARTWTFYSRCEICSTWSHQPNQYSLWRPYRTAQPSRFDG